jgi:hypothetical protein
VADTSFQVSAGTGTFVHTSTRTVGGNTTHDEVFVAGETVLPLYVAGTNTGAASTATAASHLWQIMAGASLKVRVRRIQIFQAALATTATLAEIGIYRLTTAGTGGTAANLVPMDNSSAAAGATSMRLPTAKGTEGNGMWLGTAHYIQTVSASAQINEPMVDIDFDTLHGEPLIIPAGTTNGIAVKQITAVAGATVYVNIWVSESSY